MFTRLRVLLALLYLFSFMSIGLFITPAYGEVQSGLNWYAKIDVSDTSSLSPNYNTNDYLYCGVASDINYNWGSGASTCTPNDPDFYTNLWVGYVTAPESGFVTFYSSNDDGFILKINGEVVINSWWEQGSWWYNGQGSYYMNAGESYTIEVLHHETGGGSVAQLFWLLPNTNEIVTVPPSAFTLDPVINEPDPYLNPPTNLFVTQGEEKVILTWDAPQDSGTAVERYAVMWNVEGGNGWGIASTQTSIEIPLNVLRSTAPLDQTFTFSIRSDNDTLGVYSTYSDLFSLVVSEPPSFICWDGSVVGDETQCPERFLNAPTNLTETLRKEKITLDWTAPQDSGTPVENYIIKWIVNGNEGQVEVSNELSIEIPFDLLRATAPLDQTFSFSVIAKNATFSLTSQASEPVNVFIEEPPAYVCWDGSVVKDESQCPPPPPPPPTYECWDGSIVEDLSQCPPVPPTVECWDGTLVYELSECPIQPPSVECWDGSMVYDQSECPVQPEPEPEPEPTPDPEPLPEPVDPTPPVEPITPEEPSNVDDLIDNLEEGESISAEQLAVLGIDYSELPPDTPVQLENGVIITAEVADALEIFEDASELLSAVFTDPSKALTAIANVGADLPPAVREQAQEVVVASVIVTQVISSTASLLTRRI